MPRSAARTLRRSVRLTHPGQHRPLGGLRHPRLGRGLSATGGSTGRGFGVLLGDLGQILRLDTGPVGPGEKLPPLVTVRLKAALRLAGPARVLKLPKAEGSTTTDQ